MSLLRIAQQARGVSSFAFAMHRRDSAALSLLHGKLIKCWHCVSSAHTFPLYNILAAQACVEIRVHTKTCIGYVAFASNVDSVLPCGGRISTFVLACSLAGESFARKRIISAVDSVACQAQSATARDELFAFVQRQRVRI